MTKALFFLILVFGFTSCVSRSSYVVNNQSQMAKKEKLDWQVQRPVQHPVRHPVQIKKVTRQIVQQSPSLPPPITKPSQPIKRAAPSPVKEVVKTATIVKKKELIVLDAGHGGKDTGALGKKNVYVEKNLTLQTVNMLKSCLNQMGYEVRLTRHEDKFVSLEDRALLANKNKAALFVSIHYNYCASAEVEGIEVFYHKDEKNPYTKRLIESRKLGEAVLSKIVKNTGAVSRGVKKANFAVIRETTMPAILIEGGFLSNPEERKKILNAPYLRSYAQGIANGIDNYLASIKK